VAFQKRRYSKRSPRAPIARATIAPMRSHRASFTARFVAASRGLSPLLPSRLRLVDDPHGAAFAGPALASLVRLAAGAPRGLRALAWGPLLPMLPWAVYMQVRTRFFDDAIEAFARDGGRQLVILGAGFDARGARLRPRRGGALPHRLRPR